MTPAPSARSRHLLFVLWIVALLSLGLELRLIHMEDAWSYWMPAYVRYARPHWLDLGDGVLPWRRLVGLHPPLWALITAALAHAGATMRGLIAVPLLCSLGSAVLGAVLVRRVTDRRTTAAFVALLVIAPYQVHYATELNNYPLLQLGTAALAVSVAAAWNGGTREHAILAVVVGVGLWAHFASAPLVLALGVCAVLTRRWRVAAATVAGVLLASPILLEALSLTGASQTFHNEPLSGLALLGELRAIWAERFVPTFASAALGLATVAATGWALRARPSRDAALLLTMMLAVAGTWVLAGFSSGASFYAQTPYWLPCSWLGLVLLALGLHAAPQWGRWVLVALTGVWLVGVGQRAFTGPTDWDPSEARQEVLDYLGDVNPDQGDVLVYLWDGFGNDLPHLRDPFHGAIRIPDVAPFAPREEPLAIDAATWGNGRLVHRHAALRGDDPELAEAIAAWLREGRVVHLVEPGWDSEREAPNHGAVRARVTAEGARWTEWTFGRATLTRIE